MNADKEYIELGPDDVIQAGDEFQLIHSDVQSWVACGEVQFGDKPVSPMLRFRRPITPVQGAEDSDTTEGTLKAMKTILDNAPAQPSGANPATTITHVAQKDRSGCGIACVAMIAGKTYEDVRRIYLTQMARKAVPAGASLDFNLVAVGDGAGLNHLELEELLERCGVKGSATIPFHNPIIRSVPSPLGGHWVVIDRNGMKHDPAQQAAQPTTGTSHFGTTEDIALTPVEREVLSLRTENQRLKEEGRYATDVCQMLRGEKEEFQSKLDSLRAENERMRAQLRGQNIHETITSLKDQLAAERKKREEAERTLKDLVESQHPSFKGVAPLVAYFLTERDREEFIEAFKEAKPNCKTIKV